MGASIGFGISSAPTNATPTASSGCHRRDDLERRSAEKSAAAASAGKRNHSAGLSPPLRHDLTLAPLPDSGAWTRSRGSSTSRYATQVPAGNGDRHRQDPALRRAHPPISRDAQRRARAVHRRPHRAGEANDGGFRRRPRRSSSRSSSKPLAERGELLGASVVVATIQSLMVDRRYREEFTPFYFDLVINDEAHRSIYGDAREVVQFFQATRIGLTATPKAYLKNINIEAAGSGKSQGARSPSASRHLQLLRLRAGPADLSATTSSTRSKTRKGRSSACRRFSTCAPTSRRRRWPKRAGRWSSTSRRKASRFKDLERKIFTPARNRLMCEAFLKEAQKDPTGSDRQVHRLRGEPEPRDEPHQDFQRDSARPRRHHHLSHPDASSIAKEFRDGKRTERIAVSVDMLSTGYNCRDLLNIGLMRPIFSPTEYIQIKGRGTRLLHVQDRQHRIREEEFLPARFLRCRGILRGEIRLHRSAQTAARARENEQQRARRAAGETGRQCEEDGGDTDAGEDCTAAGKSRCGKARHVISREVIEVGPDGEKVDVMTFRGSFERDMKDFAESRCRNEGGRRGRGRRRRRDHHERAVLPQARKCSTRPTSSIRSYGVPAPTPAFVYNAVGKKPLPTKDEIVSDTVDSIAARFNLRYNEQKWLDATAQLLADDPASARRNSSMAT